MGTFTNLGLGNVSGGTIDAPVYEGFIEPTGNGLMSIMQESSHDFYQLNAAMYALNVVHEQATLESATQADAVLESVVKDSLEKVKKFFMDLWSKIKAWFKAVIDRIKNMFLHGKKFVDANKKKLNEKNVLGFKYTGRKITPDNAAKVSEGIASKVESLIGAEIKDMESGDIANKLNGEGSIAKSAEEEKEAFLKHIGHDEVSEISKEIKLAFFNGQEPADADEIVDFSANSKGELIELVSTSSKAIRELEKGKKEIDKALSDTIKEINNKIKEVNTSDQEHKVKASAVALVTRTSNNIKFLVSILTSINAALVDGVKTATKEAERILKKYLTFKPAKESYELGNEGDDIVTESLIDRAIKLI